MLYFVLGGSKGALVVGCLIWAAIQVDNSIYTPSKSSVSVEDQNEPLTLKT